MSGLRSRVSGVVRQESCFRVVCQESCVSGCVSRCLCHEIRVVYCVQWAEGDPRGASVGHLESELSRLGAMGGSLDWGRLFRLGQSQDISAW